MKRSVLTALLSPLLALALAAPATAALTAQKGPEPIPNPGPSGTPSPGPSYSPPPGPEAAEPAPPAGEARRAARDGQELARAEGAAFATSFEDGDPQPTWLNTAEKAQNVTGTLPGGIEGSVTDKIAQVRASGEHAAAGEVKENLADTDANTKWLVFTGTGWARYDLSEPVAVVHYALTSADDAPERDRATGSCRARTTARPGPPSTPAPARPSPPATSARSTASATPPRTPTTG